MLARKVDLEGNPVWKSRGLVPVAHSAGDDINPHLALADDGVIIAFEQHFDTDRGYDVDVVVQKLSWQGELLWLNGEASIPLGNSTHLERNPRVIATSDGAHAIAFEVVLTHGNFAGDSDLFIQKVAPDGTLLGPKPSLEPLSPPANRWNSIQNSHKPPDGGVLVFGNTILSTGTMLAISIFSGNASAAMDSASGMREQAQYL